MRRLQRFRLHNGAQQLHRQAVEAVDDIQLFYAEQLTRQHDISPQALALQVAHKGDCREQVARVVQVDGTVVQGLVELQHLLYRLVVALVGQLFYVVLPGGGHQFLRCTRQWPQQPQQHHRNITSLHGIRIITGRWSLYPPK